MNRGSGSVPVFLLRIAATVATLCAAIVMGFNKQTISIFGVSIEAKYYYSPAFTFFVVANATAGLYAILSLPISVLKVGKARFAKLAVFFCDLVMSMLVTAGASAATAIAYVGRRGNSHAGWMPICDQFDSFCDRGGRALIAAFFGVALFLILTVLSMTSLYKSAS